MITANDTFRCSVCGSENGCFDVDTGNHPQCDEIVALRDSVEKLVAENADLKDYCDELAAGWPDDLLPADIRNIRGANWALAQELHELKDEREKNISRSVACVLWAAALACVTLWCAAWPFILVRMATR